VTPASKNTRQKLLKAATDLFYEKGYSETSVRDIGARAKISNSLVYHYFKNKEDLLFEILNTQSLKLLFTLLDREEKSQDHLKCFKEILLAHLRFTIIHYRKESRILNDSFDLLNSRHKAFLKRVERDIYDLYKKKLTELARLGLLNHMDLPVAIFSIFGVIDWAIRWYKQGGGLTEEEVIDQLMNFIFHGILRPGI
jgi:AcrR family transcriptional regulator